MTPARMSIEERAHIIVDEAVREMRKISGASVYKTAYKLLEQAEREAFIDWVAAAVAILKLDAQEAMRCGGNPRAWLNDATNRVRKLVKP